MAILSYKIPSSISKQTINIVVSENYGFSYYHICLATNMINTINAFNRIIEETLITNLTDSFKSKNFHPLHQGYAYGRYHRTYHNFFLKHHSDTTL